MNRDDLRLGTLGRTPDPTPTYAFLGRPYPRSRYTQTDSNHDC